MLLPKEVKIAGSSVPLNRKKKKPFSLSGNIYFSLLQVLINFARSQYSSLALH
jgi:hypothetical protein